MMQSKSCDLHEQKIVITGGAGLVGQNLLIHLLERGCTKISVLDKSAHNLAIAQQLHPQVAFTQADLSIAGSWAEEVRAADIVVLLHAQIGGIVSEEFYKNNVTATQQVLSEISDSAYIVHVSSSVIESAANDDYSTSKAQQESLVVDSGHACTVLRPTLMFGWFDRKHFGWLSNFMSMSPVFPIPGSGQYIRQPLYAQDFCAIIVACMEQKSGGSYNISGKEKIAYIDITRQIKAANGSSTLLLKIPHRLFYWLLKIYAIFDKNPPFTTTQLQALVIDEVFEDIDWESIFDVKATPLDRAIKATFGDSMYSGIRLKF